MDWEKDLDAYSVMVEEHLARYLQIQAGEGRDYQIFIGRLWDDLKEFVLRRGKRLASYSTLMTYKGYGGVMDERIMKVCCAVELYRHSILVHDDLVDCDDLRRGGATLHKMLEKGFDERFAQGVSIFAGDILYSSALHTLLDSGFDEVKSMETAKLLTIGYKEVNESQVLDLLFEYTYPDESEWNIMASRRAASLFRTAMLVGATLAEAPDVEIKLIREASTHIGFAFDIQDDLIDTFATKDQYGREPCRDLVRGKKPLHIILAGLREPAIANLQGHMVSEEKVAQLRDLIRSEGSLDKVKEKAHRHMEEARSLISRSTMNKQIKSFFSAFTYFIEKSLEWYT